MMLFVMMIMKMILIMFVSSVMVVSFGRSLSHIPTWIGHSSNSINSNFVVSTVVILLNSIYVVWIILLNSFYVVLTIVLNSVYVSWEFC